MVNATQIKSHMPVVCSKNGQFGTVDHVQGNELKLTKDDKGQHHFIPLSWVTTVDDKVHVDRTGDEAKAAWTTSPKTDGKSDAQGDTQRKNQGDNMTGRSSAMGNTRNDGNDTIGKSPIGKNDVQAQPQRSDAQQSKNAAHGDQSPAVAPPSTTSSKQPSPRS